MKLAAAEGVTADNLPSVLRRVLHKPNRVWLEGKYSDMATHFGALRIAEGQGGPTLLIGAVAHVTAVHTVEFTLVCAGKGWFSVAENPLIADVRGENMKFQGPLNDLVAATAMLSIVPTVPA
ncbi:hypothetical protein [Sulfitobacter sp. 15WGC]|jgi:hypothetical protein|uniref:hypothetical protein n=1 Tax=Sulfitobacter sp. 15WGC TaxID=2575437 RepID=UPI0010AB8E39|nr:hypothetical protein [Sulfitobacter sp. 15WGC]TKA84380.1 hypothetical protein FCK22_16195 [Sulfitobacter sp. 15WGC]